MRTEAKPHLVKDKHLTPMPKPTHREVGPLHWMWSVDALALCHEMEDYFNAKAAEGWQMVHVGAIYWGFAPCEPGEYIYRVIYLDESYRRPSSQDYLTFLTDSEVEIVAVYLGWMAIVRRKAAVGPFEIAGSISSKLARLRGLNKRMLSLLWGACVDMVIFFAMTVAFLVQGYLAPSRSVWHAWFIAGWGAFNLVTMSFCGWFAYRNLRRIDTSLADLIADSSIHD